MVTGTAGWLALWAMGGDRELGALGAQEVTGDFPAPDRAEGQAP